MGKGRGLKRKQEDVQVENQMPEKPQAPASDPARALIAICPHGKFFAVACGATVHVYDYGVSSIVSLPAADQGLPVRALAFDWQGRFLLAAGDSKICCLWDCQSWSIFLRSVTPKKISSACFSIDSGRVLMADKFGDVYMAAIPQGKGEGLMSKPEMILGHFSSVVTTLNAIPGKPWLVSTDREGKIRVSKIPAKGPSSIQTFCMGHTSFVTSLAIPVYAGKLILVSGSGDGTIRLWDPLTGENLDCFDTVPELEQGLAAGISQSQADHSEDLGNSEKAEEKPADSKDTHTTEAAPRIAVVEASSNEPVPAGEPPDDEDDDAALQTKLHEQLPPAVVTFAVYPERSILVAAVEGEDSLMQFIISQEKLVLKSRLVMKSARMPTALAFDTSGNLWAVAGCVGQSDFSVGYLPRSCLTADAKESFDSALQRVADALECAAGRLTTERGQETKAAGVLLSGNQVSLELRKWCYSAEEIARRKQLRDEDPRKLPIRAYCNTLV